MRAPRKTPSRTRRTNDAVSVSTYVWHPPAAGTTSTTPNTSNQYTSINGQTLAYDSNGNLNTDPTAPLGSATYGFDQKNRLTSASNAQHSASYTYDVFSRRAGKTVDGTGTVFVMDGSREIADYDTSGHELTRFAYGLDAAPLVEEPTSATGVPSDTWYHHVDALGTTLALTDHTGHLLHAYSTSPWGEIGGGTVGTPFRLAGMRLDPETLLYYDNARYYSPQQGRFISPDPIGAQGGVDIYAYAGNDPLSGVDLSGLDQSCLDGQSCDGYGGEDPGGGYFYNAPGAGTAWGRAHTLYVGDWGGGNTSTVDGLGNIISTTGSVVTQQPLDGSAGQSIISPTQGPGPLGGKPTLTDGVGGTAFVGGFFDHWTHGPAWQQYEQYTSDPSNGPASYFTWDQNSDLAGWISQNGGLVNVVGHSYGGDTAASVVASGFPVSSLTTVDPVSRFWPSFANVVQNSGSWTDINALSTGWTRSNIISWIGGKWGGAPSGYASVIGVPADHAGAMTYWQFGR